MIRSLGLAFASMLAVAPPPAHASETYGTATPSVVVVGAHSCEASLPTTTVSPVSPFNLNRYINNNAIDYFVCPVSGIPSGASIVSVEVEACDTSPAGEVRYVFGHVVTPDGMQAPFFFFTTGAAATPGCVRLTSQVSPPIPVDNEIERFYVQVFNTTTDGTTSFGGVRVFYRLNVAPAPAVATFGDVPVGHPQRQFVEALVSAGITGGCGPGLYCPDAPVTRGQMAVFLAVALGLHFSP